MKRAVLITTLLLTAGTAALWNPPDSAGAILPTEHASRPHGTFFGDPRLLEAARKVARWHGADSPSRPAPTAASPNPGDLSLEGTAAGLARLEKAEESIKDNYSQLASAELIRRWVALALTDIDTDFRPDLSRNRVVNELMKDPAQSASDLKAVYAALPGDSEKERAALLDLAEQIGSDEKALPAVESILAAEINRPSAGGDDSRVAKLLDRYTVLVHDPYKQLQFVEAGLASQPDERILELLRSRQSMLRQVVQAREESAPRVPASDELAAAPPAAPTPAEGN